jgi:hypothetical protein
VTLLEAPEPPSTLPSNSLLTDSAARLVSAATVEATLAVKPAVELVVPLALAAVLAEAAAATVFSAEAALDALKRVYRAEAWLLLMLPIDIMTPISDGWNQGYRPGFEELEEDLLQRSAAAARDKREPAIVGNNRIDSIEAPIIAAAKSGVIDFAFTPVWVITTMMVSDGTAEENANGRS